jgi:sodium-independent sulfate anion transporter 11
MLTPDRCLIFPSVDYVRNLVTKYSRRLGSESTPVVIDCTHIYGADFTAAKVIESLTKDFAARGQPLFFYNLKPSVFAVFEGVAPKDFIVYYTEEVLDDLLKERTSLAKQTLQNVIVP